MITNWICRHCNYSADTEDEVIKHTNNAHGIKCKDCDYSQIDPLKFQRHMEFAHNKLLVQECKICHEKFLGNDKFDKHLQFTHGTNHWDLNLALKHTKRMIRNITENY
jgi:hypothetical protein